MLTPAFLFRDAAPVRGQLTLRQTGMHGLACMAARAALSSCCTGLGPAVFLASVGGRNPYGLVLFLSTVNLMYGLTLPLFQEPPSCVLGACMLARVAYKAP